MFNVNNKNNGTTSRSTVLIINLKYMFRLTILLLLFILNKQIETSYLKYVILEFILTLKIFHTFF